MKRKYVQPILKVKTLDAATLMAGSNIKGQVDNDFDMEYGGADVPGSKDPQAKKGTFVWDD